MLCWSACSRLRVLPHLSVHSDGNTVVARTGLGRPHRVIVAGHIDTVPIAGNLPSRRENGLLGFFGKSIEVHLCVPSSL